MTLSARSIDYGTPSASSDVAPALPADTATPRRQWLGMLWTLLGLLLLFGLLQNPYWIPSGDSEFYIAIARDMVRGLGYQWNGQAVAMSPPGWPLVMAAVMKISPYFLPLKLLTMTCMTAALLCAYWIVVRFVSPEKAAFIILMTATLTYVYQSTFWLISEGLFCLVSTAALLIAFQIRDGKAQWWRIALMILFSAAAVSVRWAGVLGAIPIVAALIDRQAFPRFNRRWFDEIAARLVFDRRWSSAVLTCAFTAVAFFGLRELTKPRPVGEGGPVAIVAPTDEDTGETGIATQPTTAEIASTQPDLSTPPFTGMDQQGTKSYRLLTETTSGKGYDDRFLGWGRWFSWLYWQPFRAAAGSALIENLANIVGWMVILLLVVTAWNGVRERRWIWPAILVYTGGLAMLWPVANARYLVPIAFLITLGVIDAIVRLKSQTFWLWIWLGLAACFGLFVIFPFKDIAPDLQVNPIDGVAPFVATLIMAAAIGMPRLLQMWTDASEEKLRHLVLRLCGGLFIGVTLLCNLTLWAVDVWVARSPDFYAAYETGINQNLIAAARHINTHDPDLRDGQIAVTPAYMNLNRKRSSLFGLRSTVLLTGKSVISLPNKWQKYPPGPKLSNWMKLYDIKYYIHQTPVSPWRVWHFRVAWWQVMRTGDVPDSEVPSGWELWRFDGPGIMTQVPLDPSSDWPTRVPGL